MSTEKMILKARALAKRGAVSEARELYASILRKYPNNKRALDGMNALPETAPPPGSARVIKGLFEYYNRGQMKDLVLATADALRVYPDDIMVLRLRTAGQVELGQHAAAVQTYDTLLALDPTDADSFGNRGNTQMAMGEDAAALQSFYKVLELRPGDATALNNIGNIHIERGELDDAQTFFERALDTFPDYGPALNNLGNVLKIKGDAAGAADVLVKAIDNRTANAEAYWNFASVKTFHAGAPEIERMEDALCQTQLADRQKILIGFALGKAYDDIGDVERAFRHLSTANHIQKSRLGYRVEDDIARLTTQMAVFSERAAHDDFTDVETRTAAPKPLFIVGMPRSGTSLVEQILSAHSKIHGGGELTLLDAALSRLDWHSLDAFSVAAPDIRKNYLDHFAKIAGDAVYVTDKLPLNFEWIGAIFAMFPDAKIVHVVRDARATCWSNFKHYYSSHGNGFAYNLDDVVDYYLAYRAIMRHWEQVFGNRIYRLDYDQLTARPEPFLRDLINYLGLDWQDQCLAPEKNSRAVYTSSATQVRRAIYNNSSANWEKFAEFVGPAFRRLL